MHTANLAASLGSLLPAGFLLRGRDAGDEEREESIELRPRPRGTILTLPLRPTPGAGDEERDEKDPEDEDTRLRFAGFLSGLAPLFRERGGGDGEEDTWRFFDRLVVFFVCLLL